MFKTLVRSISLFILLLASMTFFTWLVGQLPLTTNKPTLEKNLITNVQAEVNMPVVYQPIIPKNNHITQLSSAAKESTIAKNKRIIFNFKELETKLTTDEKNYLIDMLQQLDIAPSSRVTISAGPAPTASTILSPPIAKLRTQAVARMVYPYSQTIKMLYQPKLPQNTIVIDVSQVTTK